jgi:hypothetical protein
LGTRVLSAARRRLITQDLGKRTHLDGIVAAFQQGYVCACRAPRSEHLIDCLAGLKIHHQGFAYEGAAMALALLDDVSAWRRDRWSRLLSTAHCQTYLVHVGIGWAFARVGRVEGRRFRRLDPLLRWLALDAVGFHDGFMRAAPSAAPPPRRAMLSAYGRRVFDQGLGRSLWFTTGAEPSAIALAIRSEAADRQPDLWSGIGLACAYAGGISDQEISMLLTASGALRVHMAQGAAFAAEAHVRAAHCAPLHTERACRLVCRMSAADAALIARECSANSIGEGDQPAYETWRARVTSRMSSRVLPFARCSS